LCFLKISIGLTLIKCCFPLSEPPKIIWEGWKRVRGIYFSQDHVDVLRKLLIIHQKRFKSNFDDMYMYKLYDKLNFINNPKNRKKKLPFDVYPFCKLPNIQLFI